MPLLLSHVKFNFLWYQCQHIFQRENFFKRKFSISSKLFLLNKKSLCNFACSFVHGTQGLTTKYLIFQLSQQSAKKTSVIVDLVYMVVSKGARKRSQMISDTDCAPFENNNKAFWRENSNHSY